MMMDRKEADGSAQEIQADLSEVERDLTLRRLLWESQEEWDRLAQEWTQNSFDVLNVEALQKNVNRFTQTVFMLEKGKEMIKKCFFRHHNIHVHLLIYMTKQRLLC